ncbi:MAG: hypothetical protein KatS3mg011_1062 [Acidimicrobiia bacterium]|nr:MAG: hypothetical protein KatS3mg011_1062 [Acidimicrobiia bacterium]
MSTRKHVVSIVGNDIDRDARVRKVAATAALAGFRSTVVCYTAAGGRRTSFMGDVEVIRVPVPWRASTKNGRVPNPLRPFNARELADRHAGPRAHLLARKNWTEGILIDPRISSSTRFAAMLTLSWIRFSLKIRHETFRIRRRAHADWDRLARFVQRLRKRIGFKLTAPLRDPIPNIADYEVSFGPILLELEPDLIHAHDFHMIGIAVTAARKLRQKGRPTKVVYDAHEWIPGLSYPARTLQGWRRLERRYITYVDAVLGVSPEQTRQLQDAYALPEPPIPVLNAPIVDSGLVATRDIRSEIGSKGPIVVYHGNIKPERGLRTAIEALRYLDSDVCLAILAPPDSPLRQDIAAAARSAGIDDRVHLLDYIPAEQLPEYLSTADLAVIPYELTGNNDIALPNKLFDALQAGLPLLVSNMRAMSRLVSEHHIGEVFQAGDAQDLAEKARLILAAPDHYRSRINEDLKQEYSWDAQARRLLHVYGTLLETPIQRQIHVKAADISERGGLRSLSRPPRLMIGPRNMAGQAFAIAKAVQDHLGIPAVSMVVDEGRYRFPAHLEVSGLDWRDANWQSAQRVMLTRNFTHVLAESGTGVLGAMNGGFIDEQLDELREAGIEVAVLFHGSEIRDPERHRKLPFSPYALEDPLVRRLERAVSRLRSHVERLHRAGVPFFVTTPDLLKDVEATWLPVVVDVDTWGRLAEPFRRDPPAVLHLPTNPLLKGSDHIDRVLEGLAADGLLEYMRPDAARPSEVESLVAHADIVIDQLVIGAYGVMACQAMAAGRVVVANVRDIGTLRDECPIVHADPGTFRATLLDLLTDRSSWKDRGEAGRWYARRYHDGTESARVLQSFLSRPDR